MPSPCALHTCKLSRPLRTCKPLHTCKPRPLRTCKPRPPRMQPVKRPNFNNHNSPSPFNRLRISFLYFFTLQCKIGIWRPWYIIVSCIINLGFAYFINNSIEPILVVRNDRFRCLLWLLSWLLITSLNSDLCVHKCLPFATHGYIPS
jgi:hypothetical protein